MSEERKNDIPARIKTSIGGQALIEGIMMRGPKMSAMAVRNPKGEIVLEKWQTEGTTRAKLFRLPVIRGVFNFVDSLKSGYKCLMRSAEIAGLDEVDASVEKSRQKAEETAPTVEAETAGTAPESGDTTEKAEEKEKTEKKESGLLNVVGIVSIILSVALMFALFFWLPLKIYEWMPDKVFDPDNRYLRSVFTGLFKTALLVGYMAAVSLMKDIRRTFMFHGAEHKTIFCYEAGLELTVENVRRMKRFHPRCGTSFLIIMVLVGMLVGFLIPPTLPTPVQAVIKICLVPVIVGLGYELIKFAGRHDNLLTKIISAPGLWLQRITVLEPDDDMIECAIAAVREVIPEDGSDRW